MSHEKRAYDIGVKLAARMGVMMPTGYKFTLNDDYLSGLDPDTQAKAKAHEKVVNDWLKQNANVGHLYAQHPDFSRLMAQLQRMSKSSKPHEAKHE